tara:strand:- start:99 stop:422 length:324 start_codon:yes stop_codon:yes gene_type:complete
MKTFELNDREITILLEALGEFINSPARCTDDLHPEAQAIREDLNLSLRELLYREDEWASKPDAAAQFVQAGIDAREQAKAAQKEAEARVERMMKGTASPIANDPLDW